MFFYARYTPFYHKFIGNIYSMVLALLLHRLGNELGNGVCLGDY